MRIAVTRPWYTLYLVGVLTSMVILSTKMDVPSPIGWVAVILYGSFWVKLLIPLFQQPLPVKGDS